MTTDEAIAAIAPYTMLTPERLRKMLPLLYVLPPGCVVQCGVWRGGSGALLAWATGRQTFLFDRFTGMPKPGGRDGERALSKWRTRKDWCKADIADVETALGLLGVTAHVVPGDFADTFPLTDTGPVALLHIDADWYESTRLCLDNFLPLMAKGGVVIVDDYNHWPGCKLAVDQCVPSVRPLEGPAVWFLV